MTLHTIIMHNLVHIGGTLQCSLKYCILFLCIDSWTLTCWLWKMSKYRWANVLQIFSIFML